MKQVQRSPEFDGLTNADQKLEHEPRNSLTSLIFGSAGFGFTSKIPVDRSFFSLEEGREDDNGRGSHAQFPDVNVLLEAIDDNEVLQGLFELKELDHELAFALRHALIFFLQRLDQGGATAVGLMVETLVHFMKEHPILKGYVRRWDDKFADAAPAAGKTSG